MLRRPDGTREYRVGDRVVVSIDDEHRKGTVVYPLEQAKRRVEVAPSLAFSESYWVYPVRLDGERDVRRVPVQAIVNQACEDKIGHVEHLDEV